VEARQARVWSFSLELLKLELCYILLLIDNLIHLIVLILFLFCISEVVAGSHSLFSTVQSLANGSKLSTGGEEY